MTVAGIDFAPLLPWPWFLAGAALAGLVLLLGPALPPRGRVLRVGAALLLLLALAGPERRIEERIPEADVVFLVIDESRSQRLSDRADQTRTAAAAIRARLAATGRETPLEIREVRVPPAPPGRPEASSAVLTALLDAASTVPARRIAGAILVSDGQVLDIDRALARAADLPRPLHLLLTGHADDFDLRLVIRKAPPWAIVGEETAITFMVEADGPDAARPAAARVEISVDDGAPEVIDLPPGLEMTWPLTLTHGGENIVRIAVTPARGELTDRNNTAFLRINGIRDRLRVLLVSGEPHVGERTWRNLLKADPGVDLVHFTILRPPGKSDGVPYDELSLIAFPVRELFLEKIDEFDLIIFDRYPVRGILPAEYLANIARYVEKGGALLVTAGPEYAGAASLYRTPLRKVLPAAPQGPVLEEPYLPHLTATGRRHPVTATLEANAPRPPAADGSPGWGRWLRQVQIKARRGEVAMTGARNGPLLVLDRVGKGRVALLGSDQIWLWHRGFEGGGPQAELLRRLAYWTMKEPDLEEEALIGEIRGDRLSVLRRTLAEGPPPPLVATDPEGGVHRPPWRRLGPGRFEARLPTDPPGLWHLVSGDLTAIAATGPAMAREFARVVADAGPLAPVQARTGGGVFRLEDGLPEIRRIRPNRPVAGRGWLGLVRREAHSVVGIARTPLLPLWLAALAALSLLAAGWLIESRPPGRRR